MKAYGFEIMIEPGSVVLNQRAQVGNFNKLSSKSFGECTSFPGPAKQIDSLENLVYNQSRSEMNGQADYRPVNVGI